MTNFTHDCEQCTFLGKDIFQDAPVDMYFCEQNGLPTVIMRYGNDGADYTSAPISVINSNLATFSETPMVANMLIAEDKQLWSRA